MSWARDFSWKIAYFHGIRDWPKEALLSRFKALCMWSRYLQLQELYRKIDKPLECSKPNHGTYLIHRLKKITFTSLWDCKTVHPISRKSLNICQSIGGVGPFDWVEVIPSNDKIVLTIRTERKKQYYIAILLNSKFILILFNSNSILKLDLKCIASNLDREILMTSINPS